MSFSLDLSKATKAIQGDATRMLRGTLFRISGDIIKGTPVGNPTLWKNPPPPGYVGGSLRGAWQASVGAPNTVVKNTKDDDGAATIADMSNMVFKWVPGEVFYLTNPLPYALRVEYGWSTQRPQGMVRVAVMQAQKILDGLSK